MKTGDAHSVVFLEEDEVVTSEGDLCPDCAFEINELVQDYINDSQKGLKLKIWYKDGEFPEPGKGYEEFPVRAEHDVHDRVLLFKGQSSPAELVVDEKKSETTSRIRSIETDKILQWRLVEHDGGGEV